MTLMEQPLLIALAGIVITAALVGGLIKTGRKSLLFAAIGSLVLTLGLLAFERATITPREQVKATLHVMAHHLEQNDVEAIVSHLSKDREDLQRDARLKMALVEILRADIKNNLKVELYSDRGYDFAEARFNAVFRFRFLKGMTDGQQNFPQFFILRFRSEDGDWRVRDYEMHDPRAGIGS